MIDVVVAEHPDPGVPTRVLDLGSLNDAEGIFDIGPRSVQRLLAVMDRCKSLVWNGPLGVFEVAPFDQATVTVAWHAAELTSAGKLVTVAGGGDTEAALKAASVSDDLSYVSTAGGAFLEWMEGKVLPGVAALEGEARTKED